MRSLVLLALLAALPAMSSAYDVTDSQALALTFSGELLPPPALEAKAAADLVAIRAEYPYFDMLGIHPWLDWVTGRIMVKLTEAAYQDFLLGNYTGLDDLNAQYGPVTVEDASHQWIRLAFDAPYHSAVLADIYMSGQEVLATSTSGIFGDGSDIAWDGQDEYVFDFGWGDCLSSCDSHHFWRLEVAGGIVTLLESYGDPITVDANPHVASQVFLEAPRPNPISAAGRIGFTMTRAGQLDLSIYDVAGRRVRTLMDGSYGPGSYWKSWDGRDGAARPVASGTYFVTLRLSGHDPIVRSVVVLR